MASWMGRGGADEKPSITGRRTGGRLESGEKEKKVWFLG